MLLIVVMHMIQTVLWCFGWLGYLRTLEIEVFIPKIRFLHFWTDECSLKRTKRREDNSVRLPVRLSVQPQHSTFGNFPGGPEMPFETRFLQSFIELCWNKGVSQVTYWVLTITRYQNNQLDMLNNLFKCAGSIIKVLFLEILIEQVQEQRNLFEA